MSSTKIHVDLGHFIESNDLCFKLTFHCQDIENQSIRILEEWAFITGLDVTKMPYMNYVLKYNPDINVLVVDNPIKDKPKIKFTWYSTKK